MHQRCQAVQGSHEGYIWSQCSTITYHHLHYTSGVCRQWGKQGITDHDSFNIHEGYWYSCPSIKSWHFFLQHSSGVQQCNLFFFIVCPKWRCHDIFIMFCKIRCKIASFKSRKADRAFTQMCKTYLGNNCYNAPVIEVIDQITLNSIVETIDAHKNWLFCIFEI